MKKILLIAIILSLNLYGAFKDFENPNGKSGLLSMNLNFDDYGMYELNGDNTEYKKGASHTLVYLEATLPVANFLTIKYTKMPKYQDTWTILDPNSYHNTQEDFIFTRFENKYELQLHLPLYNLFK